MWFYCGDIFDTKQLTKTVHVLVRYHQMKNLSAKLKSEKIKMKLYYSTCSQYNPCIMMGKNTITKNL